MQIELFHEATALAAVLVGLLTPLLTSIVQQPGWGRGKRTAAGWAVSVVVGFLTVVASGRLEEPTTILSTIVIVLTAAETAYTRLWQGSGLTTKIELATSSKVVDDVLDEGVDPSMR